MCWNHLAIPSFSMDSLRQASTERDDLAQPGTRTRRLLAVLSRVLLPRQALGMLTCKLDSQCADS